MLKQRVITAGILVAILLAAIFLFPPLWFRGFVGLFILLGAWEWSALAGLQSLAPRATFTVLCLAPMLAEPGNTNVLLLAALLWWLLAFVFVCLYPRGTAVWHRRAFLLPLGLMVLIPGYVTLLQLRAIEDYRFFILLLIALIAAADSGAYFAGRAFGKHKLAVHVSPNKTWEGFVGGQLAVCVVLWIALLVHGIQVSAMQAVLITLGALLLAAASVVGDLFESMLKRQAGMKDSGTLLPGHGGVLDRIDSLTAALPVYGVFLTQAGVL